MPKRCFSVHMWVMSPNPHSCGQRAENVNIELHLNMTSAVVAVGQQSHFDKYFKVKDIECFKPYRSCSSKLKLN